MQSQQYRLNKEDGLKILKGAGYAVGGALVTYLLSILPNVDLGQNTVFIIPVISILLNVGVKFFKGN